MDDEQGSPGGKINWKALTLLGVLVALFFVDALGIRTSIPKDKTAAALFEILAPNGGENWEFGSQQEIKWQTNNAPTVDVYLINESMNQVYRKLLSGAPNDGSEDWIVDIPAGRYKLQFETCPGCQEGSNWDTSNAAFTVIASEGAKIPVPRFPTNESLVFFSPTGGEVYYIGETVKIRWYGGYDDWQLSLILVPISPSGTMPILRAAENIQNDGEFEWTVPSNITMGNYYLRLDCTNCQSTTGASVFTFGYITLKNY